MKLTDIITQAQTISGIGVFEGNAIDQNLFSTSLAVFHQTLNYINNDARTTLWQETWDYNFQTDKPAEPPRSNPGSGQWIDISDPEEPEAKPEEETESKFPGWDLPFPVSISYPLPSDCRRVLKAFSGPLELRKSDYSELIKNRQVPKFLNMFAINNRSVHLIYPRLLSITYAKEFPEFMPQDEVALPQESLDYVINLLSYNLALAFNQESAERCRILADKSYNALVTNLTINHGEMYQNPNIVYARFL